MRYRINYRKTGVMSYTSHLDLQRMFPRLFRRAKLDIAYSQGYNPHAIMSFSPPLPLFASSADEYIEIILNEEVPTDEVYKKISQASPNGLIVNSVKALLDQDAPLSKIFTQANYIIEINKNGEELSAEQLNSFIAREHIELKKKDKKGRDKTIDIKPKIFSFEASEDNEIISIKCTLNFSNDEMLNPFVLLSSIEESLPQMENCTVLRVFKEKAL